MNQKDKDHLQSWFHNFAVTKLQASAMPEHPLEGFMLMLTRFGALEFRLSLRDAGHKQTTITLYSKFKDKSVLADHSHSDGKHHGFAEFVGRHINCDAYTGKYNLHYGVRDAGQMEMIKETLEEHFNGLLISDVLKERKVKC